MKFYSALAFFLTLAKFPQSIIDALNAVVKVGNELEAQRREKCREKNYNNYLNCLMNTFHPAPVCSIYLDNC
ncbi:hypothetical protein BCR32DRAFT_279935 [Anaeromyces robustus]|uniref:Brl1/Brr6 domain-containing protein n=1 Tax=Anaeromyces robustus TaxID=1754192 RepID=A0A1Y1X640_9FUNG|nr:hypothetical protein BCR32DRAFT_279935 [Anaeromyces robustus]|eukprot:ORX81172.1 hypothetical protein BCR32DRAFT_279935 [Anaeromyces robustus]